MKNNISKEQYENALARVEELLPLVGDDMSANHPLAVELALVSEIDSIGEAVPS